MLHNRRGHAPVEIHSNARENRKRMTPAEARFWEALRGQKVAGLKFRRQHPIDCYILDFYCVEEMLAIEVDGSIHKLPDQQGYDEERTKLLAERGVRVLRFSNDEIMGYLDRVIARINEFLKTNPKSPVARRRAVK